MLQEPAGQRFVIFAEQIKAQKLVHVVNLHVAGNQILVGRNGLDSRFGRKFAGIFVDASSEHGAHDVVHCDDSRVAAGFVHRNRKIHLLFFESSQKFRCEKRFRHKNDGSHALFDEICRIFVPRFYQEIFVIEHSHHIVKAAFRADWQSRESCLAENFHDFFVFGVLWNEFDEGAVAHYVVRAQIRKIEYFI